MKLLLMTDMEGVAGVVNSVDYCHATGRYYDLGKELLTREVNAAAAGFFAGGCREIVVVDAHGSGAIAPQLLDERLSFTRGHHEEIWPWGLDASFDALAFLGQHAKACTPYAHLAHTGNMGVLDFRINDISAGEYASLALCAKELEIPTIFASGEAALAPEVEQFTPGAVMVAVKFGLLPERCAPDATREEYAASKLSARHLAPAGARKLIEAGAREAALRLRRDPSSFGYLDLAPPWTLVRQFRADTARNTPAQELRAGDEHSLIAALNALYRQNLRRDPEPPPGG